MYISKEERTKLKESLQFLKEAEGDPIKVGCKVKVIAGPDIYKNCTGKVDWVGDNQCVVIFDDGKPVKQNLFDCSQLEIIKANELCEATSIEEDSSGDGVVTLDDGKEISVEVDGQLVTDPAVDDDEEEEPTSDTPVDEYGPKLAITDMLLQAVNDENTTIQYYNNLIAACNQEGFTNIVNVIKHINEEENIHVGMLQYAISTISEQAKDIDKGTEEAEEIMSGNLEADHESIEDNTSVEEE